VLGSGRPYHRLPEKFTWNHYVVPKEMLCFFTLITARLAGVGELVRDRKDTAPASFQVPGQADGSRIPRLTNSAAAICYSD
jgi:hypothetical protein